MRGLFIAEKPSVMRDAEIVFKKHKSEFSFDIDFVSQAGHLVGLKLPSEINPEKYAKWKLENFPIDVAFEYKINPGKEQMLQKIKTAIHSGKYDFIIHAGDSDSEGELLVNLVLDYVDNKLPVKRFWNSSTTETDILNALHNLKDSSEYQRFHDAALVRQHEDYQFGMNITGVTSIKLGELYKLGRVKAAIIRMLVDRERAIRNFIEKCSYKRAFTFQDCVFLNDNEYETEEKAKAAFPHVNFADIIEVKTTQKEQKAPKLYKLSTLQTDMYAQFGISIADTLAIVQKLYESRAVSYPRTNCEYLSSAVDFHGILSAVTKEITLNPTDYLSNISKVMKDNTYINDKAIVKEGHTAIIPTGQGFPSNLGERERKVYDAIVRRFIAIFAEHKLIKGIQVQAKADDENYIFKHVSDISGGYEFVLNPDYKMRPELPITFQKGMRLCPIIFITKEFKTKPPARFNQGSLVTALDSPEIYKNDSNQKITYSIGTQATRAAIISQCQECGYFTIQSGKYYATEKAERVIDELGDISLFNITNSAIWENMLEQVRHGEISAQEVENTLYQECQTITHKIKDMTVTSIRSNSNVLGKCPNCGGEIVTGKFGAFCKNKCGMSIGKAMGKKLTDAQVKASLNGTKFKLSGLISANTGKPYNIFLTSTGIEDFSYKDKVGNIVSGKQFVYKREFENQFKK